MKLEDFEKKIPVLLDKIGFLVEGKAKELCPVDRLNNPTDG